MKAPTVRKPPLPESTNRLRPRRVLRSNASSIQTTPAMKTPLPNLRWDLEESQIRPEYQSISCELLALAKMVENDFGNRDLGSTTFANAISTNPSSLFERGRFYDEYSARRNERLNRKKYGETGEGRRAVCNLGVTVESGKKRDSKKLESLKKSVNAKFSIDGSENARYYLRSSSKEIKKPPIVVNSTMSAVNGDRKIMARRVRKS